MLLDARDSAGEPLVFSAVRNHNLYLTKFLTVKGADVNVLYRGDTPLTLAIKHAFLDIVDILMKHPGTDVGMRDACGETPLGLAAANGHVSVIRLLLARGADARETGRRGEPIFFQLARKGLVGGVNTLLEHGADITSRDAQGRTLLYYLLQHRCEDAFITWLPRGIPLDHPPRYPSLMEVATEGSMYFAVKSLLLMDPRLRTRRSLRAMSGERLMHMAFRNNHTLLSHLFITWEAAVCIQRAWARYRLLKGTRMRGARHTG
jgi:hypothetical protein